MNKQSKMILETKKKRILNLTKRKTLNKILADKLIHVGLKFMHQELHKIKNVYF